MTPEAEQIVSAPQLGGLGIRRAALPGLKPCSNFSTICAQKAASGSPRLDQVCDHVQRLISEGGWTPRYETFPFYQSPLPEFSKEP